MKLLSNLNTGVFKRRPEELIYNDVDKAVPKEDIRNIKELAQTYKPQLNLIAGYWEAYKKINNEQNRRLNAGKEIEPDQIARMNAIEASSYKIFKKLPASLKKLSFTKIMKFGVDDL